MDSKKHKILDIVHVRVYPFVNEQKLECIKITSEDQISFDVTLVAKKIEIGDYR